MLTTDVPVVNLKRPSCANRTPVSTGEFPQFKGGGVLRSPLILMWEIPHI